MAEYKIHCITTDGAKRTFTEPNPNMEASQEQLGAAAAAVADVYGLEPVSVGLSSETTVWQYE